MTLELYAHKLCLLDISESTTVTAEVDIPGLEVVAVAMPDALSNDGSTEVTFQVDPGDGTFRELQDDSSAALTLTDITAGDIAQVQEGKPPICGAKIRLVLAVAEGANRKFFLMCRPLAGSSR